MLFSRMFSRRWIILSILAAIMAVTMIRLGIWQLDRLKQRRLLNSQVLSETSQPVLILDQESVLEDLAGMEYRKVQVRGTYDPTQEVALGNQAYQGKYGVHLLTPLKIEHTDRYILVDRGWVPGEDVQSSDWSRFSEPGTVDVLGVLRNAQQKSGLALLSNTASIQELNGHQIWMFVNIAELEKQSGYTFENVYIQQSPDPNQATLPYRTEPELDLTEGPHLGYALQWFTFASIVLIGYPLYIKREEGQSRKFHA